MKRNPRRRSDSRDGVALGEKNALWPRLPESDPDRPPGTRDPLDVLYSISDFCIQSKLLVAASSCE